MLDIAFRLVQSIRFNQSLFLKPVFTPLFSISGYITRRAEANESGHSGLGCRDCNIMKWKTSFHIIHT